MYRLHRGAIPAILILICAARFAGASMTLDASDASQTDPTSPDTGDVSWVLEDDRTSLPQDMPVLESDQSSDIPTDIETLNAPAPVVKSHVDSPQTTAKGAEVNELMVPVPVLNVGWGIVLFVVLFHIGTRVLRLHRRTSVS
jgi:hypothetical protein